MVVSLLLALPRSVWCRVQTGYCVLDLKYKVNYCKEVQVSGHCEECLSRATLVIRRRAAADGDGPGLQKGSWVKFRSQFSVCDYSPIRL